MPTLTGLRRRGYTPEAIRAFCEEIGVTKANSTIDIGVLENALRADLNRRAPRRMAVLDPLELVIENYPEDAEEELEAENNPEAPSAGRRRVPFARRLWIERDDFRAEAPRKFHRLTPGREVRLRYAYYVTCTGFDADPVTGAVQRVRCRYDPATRGGDSADGRTVRGTIHWVSARHAATAEVRLFDHLFACDDPEDVPEGADFLANLNPHSRIVLPAVPIEPALAATGPGSSVQFERKGYFCADALDWRPERPVFNRSVALKDSWAKVEARS
jgi:glutaminyl-tRNA synthetase